MKALRRIVVLVVAVAWGAALGGACGGAAFTSGGEDAGGDGAHHSTVDGGADVENGVDSGDGTSPGTDATSPPDDSTAPGSDASDATSPGPDAPALDAPIPEASVPDGPAATYGDVTNPGSWQTIAGTNAFDAGPLGNTGSWGAAFDGRYVYYAPQIDRSYNKTGLIQRYDTQGNFLSGTSWSFFDLSSLNSAAVGYAGAEFDGRYVYFVPFHNATTASGLVGRYDTQAPFSMPTSFDLFDMAAVTTKAQGYAGGAFDGKYLYFAPYVGAVGDATIAVRFDSTASFTTKGSWSSFDMSTLASAAIDYAGAVFDGRYVYFVPNGGSQSGFVTRYDTQGTFTDAGAWSVFDMTTVHSLLRGFIGGVFDGRYVYFVPYNTYISGNPALSGRVGRYDTTGSFTAASSWSSFDVATVNASAVGYQGGVFDGRYLYLIPAQYPNTTIARFDTTASFTSPSWSVFNMSPLSKYTAYAGGAFDGEYVYLAPAAPTCPPARFDAKTPPSMPPSYRGSFF